MLAQEASVVNGFAPKNNRSSIHPATAFAIKRLREGCSINGDLVEVPPADQPLVSYMESLKTEEREIAFNAYRYLHSDPDSVTRAVFVADGIEPDAEPVEPDVVNIATFADIKSETGDYKWVWNGWIPESCLCAIAAHEGTGKTRLSLDLARRVWFAETWPDGQPPSLPPRSKTLWVISDQNHPETMLAAEELGVPLESMLVNSTPENVYSGTDLDDGSTITLLRKRILHHRPALVFIDTLNGSTEKDLCAANSTNQFFKPLKKMAQDAGVTFIINAHLTRFDKLYGKRTGENVRSVIMLTQPDESAPNRRRLETSKTFGKRPPALGITFGDGRLDYDFDPPRKPDDEFNRGRSSTGKRGPEPVKLMKAKDWLLGRLQAGPEWMHDTFKAAESMIDAGEFSKSLVYDAAKALNVEQFQDEHGKKYWRLPVTEADDQPNKDDF
jgi:hypothetical protein